MNQADELPLEQEGSHLSVLDLALVLAENLRLLILAPLGVGLLVLGLNFLITPTFTATSRILPPIQQQSAAAMLAAQLGQLSGMGAAAAGLKNPADQYIALLQSAPVLDALIERFNLKSQSKSQNTTDLRRSLSGRTKISAGLKDGIISISVDDEDPARAAAIANAYAEELRNLMATLAITEPAQRRLFYQTQLKETKDNLTKAEIALQSSGISVATLKTVPQSALEVLARIRAQITAQEIRLASMRTSMTDANPDYRAAIQELAALRIELAKAERSNVGQAPGEGAEYIAKFRDFKYHETLFELISKQYEIARLDEAREGTVVQVLEVALPPERKSKPQKAINAIIATFIAFVLMVVFVFVRHGFHSLMEHEESAAKLTRLRQLLRLRRS